MSCFSLLGGDAAIFPKIVSEFKEDINIEPKHKKLKVDPLVYMSSTEDFDIGREIGDIYRYSIIVTKFLIHYCSNFLLC